MKIMSVVDEARDCEYRFRYNPQTAIPVGATVTVEWDESEHHCKHASAEDRFVQYHRIAGKWHVMERWRGQAGECLLENVLFCPFCGKRLSE